jgi:hypothetical protein
MDELLNLSRSSGSMLTDEPFLFDLVSPTMPVVPAPPYSKSRTPAPQTRPSQGANKDTSHPSHPLKRAAGAVDRINDINGRRDPTGTSAPALLQASSLPRAANPVAACVRFLN